MSLQLSVRGDAIWRHCEGDNVELRAPAGFDDALSALNTWSAQYRDIARLQGKNERLLPIGRAMLEWLNQGDALRPWLQSGTRELEIDGVDDADPLVGALLGAPWELLADATGHLALSAKSHFTIVRRVAPAGTPRPSAYRDIAMLFMAAAPEGQHELDYEAEEAAILDATRDLSGAGEQLVRVTVEESGELPVLAARNVGEGTFDVLHLSCHGEIKKEDKGPSVPILLFEDGEGGSCAVSPDKLVEGLGQAVPSVLFLSACRTGEFGAGRSFELKTSAHKDAGANAAPVLRDASGVMGADAPEVAEPYTRRMAKHVPHVLGWDGSVYDADASTFARAFYDGLSKGQTVAFATAVARRAVVDARSQDVPGEHWHMARLYLGPNAGGPICNTSVKASRPAPPPASDRFLDAQQQVKVASRSEFVGRRRELQKLRREFAAGRSGALVYGLGNLGKSSLAARLADRMPTYKLAVVYGQYHGLAIFNALESAVTEVTKKWPREQRKTVSAEMSGFKADIAAREDELFDAVLWLLENVFYETPLLLVIDDLEQALQTPHQEAAKVTPKPGNHKALCAVLRAFAETRTASRVLLTSRYDFAAVDAGGVDRAAGLVRVPLTPMKARGRQKQWRAKSRQQGHAGQGSGEADAAEQARISELAASALKAAAGNPGLQDILTRPLLQGELDIAEKAIEAVQHYRETGEYPQEGNAAGEFFQRVSFETYAAALSETERVVLAVASLFDEEVAIPRRAIVAAAQEIGIDAPDPALDRLLALGLVEDHGEQAGWPKMPLVPHLAANVLARPCVIGVLDDDLTGQACHAALPELATAWRDRDGDFPRDLRGEAACRVALAAPAPDPALLGAAGEAAVLYRYDKLREAPAALALAVPTLERLFALGAEPSHRLLGNTINAAAQAGDVTLQERLLEQAADLKGADKGARAQLLGLKADRLERMGDLDGALRIREEEVLPVFEALGDRRSVAVYRGQIADILVSRGDLDGALRIREEEQLPVFEALGDRRELAVCRGQIAEILERRGDLDGALRIREEEMLPVLEALGDRRSVAVCRGKIADILVSRGDLDGALRIREEEMLPVFEALGDRRELAVCRGQIANILYRRGDLDAALRMHESRLPVAIEMGDLDSLVHIRSNSAQIRLSQGQHQKDGGLQQIYEELHEAFEGALKLKRPDFVAWIGTLLAQVLAMGGAKDGALSVLGIAKENFEKLGSAQGVAHCDEMAKQIGGMGK